MRIDLNLFKRAKTACVRVLAMTDLYNVATQLSLASLSALMHDPTGTSTSIYEYLLDVRSWDFWPTGTVRPNGEL